MVILIMGHRVFRAIEVTWNWSHRETPSPSRFPLIFLAIKENVLNQSLLTALKFHFIQDKQYFGWFEKMFLRQPSYLLRHKSFKGGYKESDSCLNSELEIKIKAIRSEEKTHSTGRQALKNFSLFYKSELPAMNLFSPQKQLCIFLKALNKLFFFLLQRKGEMFIPHRSTVKITQEAIEVAFHFVTSIVVVGGGAEPHRRFLGRHQRRGGIPHNFQARHNSITALNLLAAFSNPLISSL